MVESKEVKDALESEAFMKYLMYVTEEISKEKGNKMKIYFHLQALATTSMMYVRGELPHD